MNTFASNALAKQKDDELTEIRDMMRTFATNNLFLQQHVTSLQQKSDNMEIQIGQIVSSMERLEAQISGKLPSQALNMKESVKAIELMSRKTLGEQKMKEIAMKEEEELEPCGTHSKIVHGFLNFIQTCDFSSKSLSKS